MSKTEDTIPTIEVMESHESGKNTVGKNLKRTLDLYPQERGQLGVHNQAKDLVKVCGIFGCDCFC